MSRQADPPMQTQIISVVWWNFLCRWRNQSLCCWSTNQRAPGPHQHQRGHCDLDPPSKQTILWSPTPPCHRREKMVQHHDSAARVSDLPHLHVGQPVHVLDKTTKMWFPGTIHSQCNEPHSYIVETPNRNQLWRNRSMLREMLPKRLNITSEPSVAPSLIPEVAEPVKIPPPPSPPEPEPPESPGPSIRRTRYDRAVIPAKRFQK